MKTEQKSYGIFEHITKFIIVKKMLVTVGSLIRFLVRVYKYPEAIYNYILENIYNVDINADHDNNNSNSISKLAGDLLCTIFHVCIKILAFFLPSSLDSPPACSGSGI